MSVQPTSVQTNSNQGFNVVGAVDPRINASNSSDQVYVAYKGASIVSKKIFTTTSFSNSAYQFSSPPPNNKIFIDRLVWQKIQVRFDFDQDIRPALGSGYGLRQWPVGGIWQTATCSINTNQTSLVTSDVLHALTRYSTNHTRQDRVNSLSASMPDQFQSYADWTNPLYGGSARNPLSAYGEQYYQNRGAIQPDSVAVDGKSATYTLMEPIWLLSPFLYEEEEHLGLVNVSTMDWNFNLVTNLGARMWCSDNLAVNPITTVTATILASPELHFTYLTPPEMMFIPNNISYPYHNIIRFTSANVVVPAGTTVTNYSTNNMQLTEIPRRVYVFIQENNAQKLASNGFLLPDTWASISNVNITFNNLTSMFANYQQQDLYDLCRKNGLEMSWQQFKTFCGSVIAFEPAFDFGLPSILSAGSLGQFNLQITLTFTNTSGRQIDYVPFVVVVNEGIMNIGTNGTIIQTGVLGRSAVLNSQNLPYVQFETVQNSGGSIFGKLKSFLTNARPFINKLSRVGEVIGDTVSKVGLPYGSQIKNVSSLARQLTGGARRYKRRGRGLYGA